MADLDSVVAQAFELSTLDKVRLIEKVTPKIEEEVQRVQAEAKEPFPSLWGVCKDFGTSLALEDFQEARRDGWANFPRDDI